MRLQEIERPYPISGVRGTPDLAWSEKRTDNKIFVAPTATSVRPYPPIKVVLVATSAVSPINTPHGTVISPDGIHLAAGMLWIKTVSEPFMMMFGGPTGGGGIGGWMIPGGALITPEHTTAQPT